MLRQLVATLTGLTASLSSAQAADFQAPPPRESDWSFTFAPYFWAGSLTGDVEQFGLPELDVKASFRDIIRNFDLGFMGAGEARNGRFSIATDIMWIKLSADENTPLGLVADDALVELDTLTLTGTAGYSVLMGKSGNLDIIGGARLWSVDTKIDLDGGILDGKSRSDGDTWVDPVIGLKGKYELSSDIYLTGWGIVGGFDVSSKFMWDVFGGVGHSFNDRFSVLAGFRAEGVDYRHGDFEYDVIQYGPMIGAVIRF